MRVFDPIYGHFCLPHRIRPLVLAPEVRRLSQIRLLNTLTPTLATLGEIRRFSHTLGVLHLSLLNHHLATKKKWFEFAAAVLLHDIGTPPFGHLLEYFLKERKGWDHEAAIQHILWGSHVPENRAHQIFGNQTIKFRSLLERARIDPARVEMIVDGTAPLSKLLFGGLDFDNLDNVVRMSWALGCQPNTSRIVEVARALNVGSAGQVLLSKSLLPNVECWASLRAKAYEIIAFDAATVAAQAVLSEAFEAALLNDVISEDDWALTDEELIAELLRSPHTKRLISSEYLGRLPDSVLTLQLAGDLKTYGFTSRSEAKNKVTESVLDLLGKSVLAYVFVDKGTFGKDLAFVDPDTGEYWRTGVKSSSVIFYVFNRQSRSIPHRRCMQAVDRVLAALNASAGQVLRCEVGANRDSFDDQRPLNITPS